MAPTLTSSPSVGLPGIARVGTAGRFRYRSSEGDWVVDPVLVDRIHRLAVPPAWTDVWISEQLGARVQATGRDARGRKQYRYSAAFRRAREADKFSALTEFARVLPRLRRAVQRDLRRRGLPREKVLATVVALLEETRIRIGNREYAEANHSYGLTTLRPQQVIVEGDIVRFVFRGKSGRRHRVMLEDHRLARIVAQCRAVPGQDLFQYAAPDGTWVPIRSDDVNAYLRDVTRSDITAKEFRTWSASVLALSLLRAGAEPAAVGRRSALGRAIQTVADELGNSPIVSRASYIHPRVISGYLSEGLDVVPTRRGMGWLSADERRLVALLEQSASAR